MKVYSAYVSHGQQMYALLVMGTAVGTALVSLDLGHSLQVGGFLLYGLYLLYIPAPSLRKTLPEAYQWYRSRPRPRLMSTTTKFIMYLSFLLLMAGFAISFHHFIKTFP